MLVIYSLYFIHMLYLLQIDKLTYHFCVHTHNGVFPHEEHHPIPHYLDTLRQQVQCHCLVSLRERTQQRQQPGMFAMSTRLVYYPSFRQSMFFLNECKLVILLVVIKKCPLEVSKLAII